MLTVSLELWGLKDLYPRLSAAARQLRPLPRCAGCGAQGPPGGFHSIVVLDAPAAFEKYKTDVVLGALAPMLWFSGGISAPAGDYFHVARPIAVT